MTRHFRAVALAAALVFAGFVVTHIAAAQDPQPSFRVEEAELDLGTIVAGTIATATFVFHNDGPDDVHIIRAKPSWGCTLAEYDSVIPAGGSGKLIANMRTAPLQDRRITKSIAVRTDAADLAILNLRFSVDVRAPIVFRPNNRLFISTVEGQEARKRVLLRRADGETLEILSADTGDPTLVAVTAPVVKKERTNDYEAAPGDVWLELVLPADSPIGSRTGKLRLSTNDPIASSFEVPFAMRVRSLIEFRPDGVRLWTTPSRSGNGYSGFVNLNRNGQGSFMITGIDVSHPEVFSAAVVSSEPAQRQTVRVELTKDLGPEAIRGTIEGWIEISTDDPIRPKVEVPVVVASTREGTRRPFQTRRTVGE